MGHLHCDIWRALLHCEPHTVEPHATHEWVIFTCAINFKSDTCMPLLTSPFHMYASFDTCMPLLTSPFRTNGRTYSSYGVVHRISLPHFAINLFSPSPFQSPPLWAAPRETAIEQTATHKHTQRHAQRHTQRHTNRQIDRQRDKHTHTYITFAMSAAESEKYQ